MTCFQQEGRINQPLLFISIEMNNSLTNFEQMAMHNAEHIHYSRIFLSWHLGRFHNLAKSI